MNMAMQQNILKYNKLTQKLKKEFKKDMRPEIQQRKYSVLSSSSLTVWSRINVLMYFDL
jgi:hypothetical protein